MRILGHALLLGLLLSQAVQGQQGSASAGGAYNLQYPSENVDGSGQLEEKRSSGTSGSSMGTDADNAASSMLSSNTTNNAKDSSFNGTSTPRSHGTEGKVCIELHFLIAGAVGIGLVSAVIAFHVSCFFMRGCKGKKKKQGQEEDQVSMQYASLQNLPIKEGDASRGPEQDAANKTCYATIADIMNEPRPTEEKDMDGASLKENP